MRLKTFEVNSFAGINPNSPVVIDFTQSKYVVGEGDMGTNKTSLINALLVACGQLSKDNKNFVNLQSGKIDINFDFVGKDRLTYNVRVTKSLFTLTYEGEALPEPITKMKELLGVVGVSPMDIKNSKLQDVIKWLSGYSNKSPEEFEKQARKFKDGIKLAKEGRAAANKVFKAMKEYLEAEQMYNEWEESEKKYIKEPDIKELSLQLKQAGDKSDKYIQNETKVGGQKTRKKQIEDQIALLQKELTEVDSNITVGDDWLQKNSTAKKDYDTVKKSYDNAAQDVADFNKWKEIKQKKADMDEAETLSQQADSKEKELQQQMKELQAEILPDLKGVELVMEDTHEDGKILKEGLYWNGKNVAQLSESEWWSVVLEIWKKYKVKIVVIDNAQSLGSAAIERLEKLAKDGCYILAAEMNREKKELQISYE